MEDTVCPTSKELGQMKIQTFFTLSWDIDQIFYDYRRNIYLRN